MNHAHLRQPLLINVGFLLNQPIGTNRDIHFEFPELSFSNDLTVLDFSGIARITRTPQGMLVQGTFETRLATECVRCLEPFLEPLGVNFSELYAFKYKSVTESNLILPDDGKIDLTPIVREYLLLEIPIRHLCSPGCLGLCAVCGANLNTELCEHRATIKME